MKAKYTTKFKIMFSKIFPDSEKLRYLSALPKLQAFHSKYHKNARFFENRNQLYDYIIEIASENPIDYLEFGVFKGASIKYWSENQNHPNSQFYGFDTFTGLPESWDNFTGGLQKGVFDTNGQIPKINDDRVHFHKGLFQESLPEFLESFIALHQTIVNIDADLYSSTLYVLTSLNNYLKKGDIIIFDEFSSMLHEFRAFEDYCKAYMITFEVIAVTSSVNKYYAHVAVRLL